MTFRFSSNSLDKLEAVHPDLVRVVNRALTLGEMDFSVVQGARTEAQQKALYAQGRTVPGEIVTWTLKSRHLIQPDGYGRAVDLAPYPLDWHDLEAFSQLSAVMKKAADLEGIKISCGIDWPEPETDADHYELA